MTKTRLFTNFLDNPRISNPKCHFYSLALNNINCVYSLESWT